MSQLPPTVTKRIPRLVKILPIRKIISDLVFRKVSDDFEVENSHIINYHLQNIRDLHLPNKLKHAHFDDPKFQNEDNVKDHLYEGSQ